MEGDRKDWEGSNIRDQKLEQDISINDQYFWSNRTLQSHLNRMEKLGSEVADMDVSGKKEREALKQGEP